MKDIENIRNIFSAVYGEIMRDATVLKGNLETVETGGAMVVSPKDHCYHTVTA